MVSAYSGGRMGWMSGTARKLRSSASLMFSCALCWDSRFLRMVLLHAKKTSRKNRMMAPMVPKAMRVLAAGVLLKLPPGDLACDAGVVVGVGMLVSWRDSDSGVGPDGVDALMIPEEADFGESIRVVDIVTVANVLSDDARVS